MIGVASYAAKATAAVERNRAAVARSERRQSDHEAARPAGDDAEALYAWKREGRELADRVESDREALAFAESRAEEARLEEANRAADARHASEEKAAAADTKLVRELDAAIQRVAKLRDALSASVARTEAFNAARGTRPHIVDAEERVRRIPGRTIPAQYRDEVQWRDGAGRTPFQWRKGKNGELEPIEAGYTREVVKVCQSQEHEILSSLPPRYADALVIVDLAGRPI